MFRASCLIVPTGGFDFEPSYTFAGTRALMFNADDEGTSWIVSAQANRPVRRESVASITTSQRKIKEQ